MKNHKNLASWFVMIQSFSFCGLCCHHTPIGVGMGAGTAAVLPLFWRTGRPLPIAKWGEMLKYVLIGTRRERHGCCYSCGFALFSRLSRALPIASHCGQVRTNGGGCSDRGTEGLLALLSCSRSASRTCTVCNAHSSLTGDVLLLSFMFQLKNIGIWLPEFFEVCMCLHVSVCVKLHQTLYFQI